jgi:fucose 4-O-acetylase-like acetyltransferase
MLDVYKYTGFPRLTVCHISYTLQWFYSFMMLLHSYASMHCITVLLFIFYWYVLLYGYTYLCNSRVCVTQVKRIVLRILYTQACLSFQFLKTDLQRRKVFSHCFCLFWLFSAKCHRSSSVWVWNETAAELCGSLMVHQFCITQWMRLSIKQCLGQEVQSSSGESSKGSGACLVSFSCV